ncbi:hypothetical protein, partial [Streptomyces viridosporus]
MADAVFVSPPWGGPEYLSQTYMTYPRCCRLTG